MHRFIINRLVQFAFVIIGASLISHIAMFVATDPARTALPVGTPPEAMEAFRAQHGLDDPVWLQYLRFVWNALHGDLGTSLWLNRPALDVVLESLPATAAIAIPATIIGSTLGIAVGVASSMRPGSVFDHIGNITSFGLISLAEFWLASVLILLFAVQLGWLPASAADASLASFVLPVAVLAIRPFAHQLQMMRASMLTERTKEYVNTARSKGLSERKLSYRHVLRNAAIPSVTLSTYELSRIFVGTAVAIEVVFAWPGIGQLAAEALSRGDVFLVQAVVVVAALIVGLLNLMADLINYWMDPRARQTVRRSQSSSEAKKAVAA